MNSATKNNAAGLADRVATVPPPQAKLTSELIFVQEQAANAKAAFKQTLGEVIDGIADGGSIKVWTQAHPWAMMSTAAVTGFVAACIAIPSKDESITAKLDELKAALHRKKSDKHDPTTGNGREMRKSFLASIVGDVIKAAIPAVGAVISEWVQHPEPPMGPSDVPPTSTSNS